MLLDVVTYNTGSCCLFLCPQSLRQRGLMTKLIHGTIVITSELGPNC